MQLRHLTLANFRNHTHSEIELAAGINLFVGPNGQGKTNAVEAVHYLATTTSHRVAGYLPLIRNSAEQAVVRAKVANDQRELLLELELNRNSKNRAVVNKAKPGPVSGLLGCLLVVCFAPEDLDIVRRDPSNRRNFLDALIVQLQPRLAGVMTDYDRVLKQRNTLLKSARANRLPASALSTLDAWDEQLVHLGSELVATRMRLIERLNPLVLAAYQSIAVSRNEPTLLLRSSLLATELPTWADDDEESSETEFLATGDAGEIAALFRSRLAAVRPKELERGLTLVGPQRDDLVLLLNGMPAKGYSSHGESWSYALALRLASLELLRQDSRAGDPVLILDDVFAELDETRRNRLADLVRDNEQVLITSADPDVVPASLTAKVFHVEQGVVTHG